MKAIHLQLVTPGDADATEAWLQQVGQRFARPDHELIRGAASFARDHLEGRPLISGEPAVDHAFGTAWILVDLHLDAATVAAAVLAPVTTIAPEQVATIRERFGVAVGDLVEGATRMAQLETLSVRHRADPRPEERIAQADALRKMLLAMVQDVRVVLVKLADHVQDLRFLVRQEPSPIREEAARLTYDVCAPLASRLGVWQLKWEMEDLSLRILEPDTYRTIAHWLDEKRVDRESYIESVVALLKGELTRSGVAAEVSGRPKHIYSIYSKMQRKGMDFEALYDVRAVRVLVDSVADCYAALGITHNLWSPIPKEFDDYIAKPKSNRYRSLHTAVIGPGARAVEIQIRTHEMHQHAELGVAAHWRYKEGGGGDRRFDEKLAWLRQILEWREAVRDAGDLAEQFRTGLMDDTIYVLTPQGKVIDLPHGATPVDFAYHVHSALGHRCRGAKVDGMMVPLNTPLANGQRVEILAAKQGGPSRDWLNPGLGYVRSTSARSKIRQWFHRQNLAASTAQGRAVVEKELQRQGVTGLNLEKLAAALGYSKVDDFLAETGRGDLRPRQLQEAVRALGIPGHVTVAEHYDSAALTAPHRRYTSADRGGILVVGVDRLLTVPARCCKPVPPEPIVGFVTRGRGVSVHRASCLNVGRLDSARLVPAQWGQAAGLAFAVDIELEAGSRPALARDVSEALARDKVRILASKLTPRGTEMRMRITLEVSDLEQLRRVLRQLRDVPGVARAARR